MGKITNIFAMLVVGLVVAAGFVSAYGMRSGNDAIRTAVENGDFDSWKEAMESEITEENFNAILERHNERELVREAIEANDYETYIELTGRDIDEDEFSEMVTRHNEMMEINEAIDAKDYETYIELTGRNITEEEFASIAEHNGEFGLGMGRGFNSEMPRMGSHDGMGRGDFGGRRNHAFN
ncbi:hypothetical protein JXM83_02370 [Candidatus Woesearchaeota archaeon]|nr:hypothetical protein [Candidatus Woesearchaeota archaeon]